MPINNDSWKNTQALFDGTAADGYGKLTPSQKPIAFFVAGIPQPKGSTKAFGFIARNKSTGQALRNQRGAPIIRTVVTSDNPNVRPWAALVSDAARQATGRTPPIEGPVWLRLVFYLPPPKYVRERIERGMKKRGVVEVPAHVVKPDVDKLTRAIGDAVRGVLYNDDAQVVSIEAAKGYAWGGTPPGAQVTVIR